jgi:two-component system, sensor histidine kinase and response regulator
MCVLINRLTINIKLYLTILISCLQLATNANNKVDSLIQVANTLPKGDSMRIILLCDASYYMHFENVNKAYNFALATQKEVLEYKHEAGKYKILATLATIEQTRSNFTQSIAYFKQAEAYAIQKGKTKWLETIYNNMANTYNLMASPANAIYYYEQSIKNAKLNKGGTWGNGYINIGALYARSGDREQAIKNFLLGLTDTNINNNYKFNAYKSIANCYSSLQNKDSALKYLKLTQKQYNESGFADATKEIEVLTAKHEYETSMDVPITDNSTYYKSLQLAKQIQNDEMQNTVYLQISKYYEKIGKKDSNFYYLNLLYQQLQIRKDYYYLNTIAKEIADYYTNAGDYKKANEYLQLSIAYADSVYVQKNAEAFKNAEVSYDVKKKEELNQSLQKQKTTQEKLKNTFLIGGLLIATLLSTILYFIYKSKKRTEALNTFIQEQSKNLQASNNFKTKLLSIISHDLRGPIVGLKMLTQMRQNKSLPAPELDKLDDEIIGMVDNTANSIDKVLQWAISQQNTGELSMGNVVINNCIIEQLNLLQPQALAKGISFAYIPNEAITIVSNEDAINIIIRNIINNAIKFSAINSTVHLSIKKETDYAYINIQDEGVGMTEEQILQLGNNISTLGTNNEKGLGLGFKLINEYCKKIKASLSISSQINQGSTFTLKLPNSSI